MSGDHEMPTAPNGPVRVPATVHGFRLAGIGDEAAAGLGGQVAALRTLGWRGLELRTVDGVPAAELSRSVLEAVRDTGLEVVCLASRIGCWARPVTRPFSEDLAELDALVRACRELGTQHIRIMSYPNDGLDEQRWRQVVLDRIRRLTDRAERAGVVLLHENCSGWAGASAERMVRLLEATNSPALRLLFDTGNGVAHGYDACAVLHEVVTHVVHVHIKDAFATPTGPVFTTPGDGQARVVDCLRLLENAGYSGWLSLEPHLAALPHEGQEATDAGAGFVAAGRRLEQMLHHEFRHADHV